MGLYSYQQSLEIAKNDFDFDALIMAAMRKADSYNILLLRTSFPTIHKEMTECYNAPGGVLNIDQ